VIFGGLTAVANVASASTSPNDGQVRLTFEGRLRLNLELLLRETFGKKQPSVTGWSDFSCAGVCSPLAKYSPYIYEFSPSSSGSSFRLGPRANADSYYGNYAQPVLIKGRTIECGTSPSEVLVELSDSANYDLHCAFPGK